MISAGMNLDPAESTHNTKVSESECSNSGNSRSLWSGSGWSCVSSSSGYGTRGKTKPGVDAFKAHRLIKRAKDKNRKKKKLKCSTASIATGSSLIESASLLASEISNIDQGNQCTAQRAEPVASTSSHKEAIDKKEDTNISMDSGALKKSVQWSSPHPLETKLEPPEPWVSVEDQFRSMSSKPESDNGFCCIISMQDGAVLFTTPSITHSLGFPREMWLGRSFIDFVHPRDRATFANQITSNVLVTLGEPNSRLANQNDQTNFLYVMLRKYRGLKNAGFGITKSTVNYQPFRLSLMFREAPIDSSGLASNNTRNIILVIFATPVCSIYKVPNESLDDKEFRFSTRHTIGGILKYVDGNSVESTGYLPQDILGRSIMELYHPEDISIFKNACESAIVKGQMADSWVSQPCRFLIKNGCYIPLQTEWIRFVNPWTKEIEFIIGNHRVLKGPSNPDVFASRLSDHIRNSFPEELLKEAKSIEEQIVQLLKHPMTETTSERKQEFSQRCKTLTTFMEQLITEMTAAKSKFTLPSDSDFTSSKRDSLIIGEMSPHHDGVESKIISETLLSYNQLNYNDNIQRFFDSCPAINIQDPLMPSSSKDANLLFGGDKRNTNVVNSGTLAAKFALTSTRIAPLDIFQPRALTEELLYKHNEDMQKVMLKKHRDAQVIARDEVPKSNFSKTLAVVESQGIKRGPSCSWEDTPKFAKHQHSTNVNAIDTSSTATKVPAACATTKPRDVILTTTAVTIKPHLTSLSNALPRMSEVWSPIAELTSHVEESFQLDDTGNLSSYKNTDAPAAIDETNDDMDISSLSSFYSSFLKTDNSSDSDGPTRRKSNDANWESASRVKRRPNPPWLDNVIKTKELVYRYQVDERSTQDLLAADMDALKDLNQPILVNEQLSQLYLDLEGEGMTTRLALSKTSSGGNSSNCSDDGESSQCQTKLARRGIQYSKLMMIYEENAPFPPPLSLSPNTHEL